MATLPGWDELSMFNISLLGKDLVGALEHDFFQSVELTNSYFLEG